jgi:hypothetical protein
MRRRDGAGLPGIQFSPVVEVARRVVKAFKARTRVDFSGLKPSTISKSLATLEDLGFVIRKTGAITITAKMHEFAKDPENAPGLLRDAVLNLAGFCTFLKILDEFRDQGATQVVLGRTLSLRLGYSWKDGTAAIVAKVLLDWARHTDLAPGGFASIRRRSRMKSEEPFLFEK